MNIRELMAELLRFPLDADVLLDARTSDHDPLFDEDVCAVEARTTDGSGRATSVVIL